MKALATPIRTCREIASALGGTKQENSAVVLLEFVVGVMLGTAPIPAGLRPTLRVANAMEAIGEHVQEEAAHELARCQPHHFRFGAAVVAIVLPAEADVRVISRDQPVVADGHAMGVAREIGKHLFGPCERPLGIDDPFHRQQGSEVVIEAGRIGELGQIAEELQLSAGMQLRESG